MIGFWFGAAALTAIALILLLRPLLRPPAVDAGPADFARKVYKDQVEEIERDLARGLLTPDQAKAARAEVGRRLLATAEGRGTGASPDGTARPSRKLALGLIMLVPLGTLAVYLPLGRPLQPSVPFAQREAERPPVPPQVLEALAKLEQRLQEEPNDLQGWSLAGATYAAMGRHAEAADAYRRAVGLSQGDPELTSAFAESLVRANDGIVGEEARRAFEAVLTTTPDDPRAAFYLGLARQQAGDPAGAIERWADLMRRSPADAPWVPLLRRQIHDVATLVGIDPIRATPDPLPPTAQAPAEQTPAEPPLSAMPQPPAAGGVAPALTPEQMRDMAALPPEEQQAMIRSMVDGLAARLEQSPGDADGWLRLARARATLGEQEAALAALVRATEAAPDRPDVWLTYAGALAPAEGAEPGPDYLAALERVLALEPENPQALYHLGEEAARRGDAATARQLWTRLLAQVPPGTGAHASLTRRLDALPRE